MPKRKKTANLSRKATPWDADRERTALQEFIRKSHIDSYERHHQPLKETNESDVINSYIPTFCPNCKSKSFKKYGKNSNLVQVYKCFDCGSKFTPTTGTIFDRRKISISEWIEYCRNLFHYLSTNSNSWNNRNSFTTSTYWMHKLFLVLESYQDDKVLKGTVWLDETYYPLRKRDIKLKEDGSLFRGLSKNQMCIGVACTSKEILCFYECTGQPSEELTFKTFSNHIAPDSILIHDATSSHKKLIEELNLIDKSFNADECKKLENDENPLDRINTVHNLLKKFLSMHVSFNREYLQGYLNLFSFMMNPPDDKLEKVELALDMAFRTQKSLRYREFFSKKG